MESADLPGPRSSVADRYRVLLDVGRTLAGTLSSEDLYAAIHQETARVLEASGFYISLYEASRDLATIVYYADEGEVSHPRISYRGSDSEVIRTRKATLVEDHLDDQSLLILGDEDSEITRSGISAPMVHKGRIVGSISAQSYEPSAYTQDDLDLLQGIADIASVAIDNALHVAELERRRREMEKLEEIGRVLTASLDPKEVLDRVIDAVLEVLNVDGASVWLCEGKGGRTGKIAESGGEIRLPEGLTWDLTGPLAEKIIEKREPVVIEDLASFNPIPEHIREHLAAGSGMGVPLIVSDRVAGILTVGSRTTRHFDKGDTDALSRLASQVSVALENARLHQHLQALTLTDPLTGLPNRRRLQIHLDKEVAAARRGRSLVVVVFDLDEFKEYNDTLGHLVGDDILRAFAQVLDEENRAMNLVARYGGDEFVSILSETHMDGARLYASRVTERVAGDEVLSEYGVTVSIGLAEFDRASMKDGEDVIQAADQDMYAAKSRAHAARRTASS